MYGFHEPSLATAIDRLQREGALQVVHWIGVHSTERTFDEDIHQWHLHGLQESASVAPSPSTTLLYELLLKNHGPQIVDQLSRNALCQRWSAEDYPPFIMRLVDWFERLLRAKSVDWVVLQNLPHEGFELVLYLVARSLGIATLMTYQSVIPNRFFYCYELADFGWFHQIQPSPSEPAVDLPREFRKDLFYMRGVDTALAQAEHLSLAERAQRQVRFAKIAWKDFKQRHGWYSFWRRPPPKIPPEQRYEWELHRTTKKKISLDLPYVYFPLHLQPELTTSAIGDQYADQIAALEALSGILPRGWRLYVKENPKQTYRCRGKSFFRRLRRLPNVVLVDRRLDTYRLLAGCKFAATITGTVGWEAISGGKRVVVFGRPWYLTLPGVHHWPTVESAEAIANQPLDHTDLVAGFHRLLRTSAAGLVDSAYRAAVSTYSADRNSFLIAEFLRAEWARRSAVSIPD